MIHAEELPSGRVERAVARVVRKAGGKYSQPDRAFIARDHVVENIFIGKFIRVRVEHPGAFQVVAESHRGQFTQFALGLYEGREPLQSERAVVKGLFLTVNQLAAHERAEVVVSVMEDRDRGRELPTERAKIGERELCELFAAAGAHAQTEGVER